MTSQSDKSSPDDEIVSPPTVECPPSQTIAVKCGTATGELYLEKLSSAAGKCILSNSVWYSPVEFEALGGRAKSKKWQKSVLCDDGVPLGSYLHSVGVKAGRASSPGVGPSSQVSDSTTSQPLRNPGPDFIIDPVLAFIKAYRLRGDCSGLKQAVCSAFDASSLSTAQKLLWECLYC